MLNVNKNLVSHLYSIFKSYVKTKHKALAPARPVQGKGQGVKIER